MGIIIFLIIIFLLLNYVATTNVNDSKSSKSCDLHKWDWDSDGFMRCTICKNRPFWDEK